MKAIVLGYHNIGCVGIEALLRNGFKIVAVFTHADDPQEYNWFGSVAELAASRNIPIFAPEDINHPIWTGTTRTIGENWDVRRPFGGEYFACTGVDFFP